MDELTKHKLIGDVISVKLGDLQKANEDELFQEHLKNETQSFKTSIHQLEKQLYNVYNEMNEALVVHKVRCRLQ